MSVSILISALLQIVLCKLKVLNITLWRIYSISFMEAAKGQNWAVEL
jgi:hypothetical protein